MFVILILLRNESRTKIDRVYYTWKYFRRKKKPENIPQKIWDPPGFADIIKTRFLLTAAALKLKLTADNHHDYENLPPTTHAR